MRKVELLLPAQNKKSIQAVLNYANAVYFGTDALNMRMNADNIPLSSLGEIVDLCHTNNLKAYLTTNVIIYENELEFLDTIMQAAKEAQIDAVIVHDFATIQLAKKHHIPFHISTQASISNSLSAQFYESLGAERVILARELSLKMINEVAEKLETSEIEVFIHGAQCTSISGRCYFSPVVADNALYSANRGKCLQPCRNKWELTHANGTVLDYDGQYFLNAKDMCMIEHIPELMESKIASFKIEGRMRDPHYIATVAQCYREAIDSYNEGTYTPEKVQQWLATLQSVYNRGFSTGFYFNTPEIKDISRDNSGNLAVEKKIQIGKVTAYYRQAKAAKIELYKGEIRLGDTIIIEGAKMGTFLNQKVESIQLKMKAITETPIIPKGKSILIGIIVDHPVKQGDWVYKYMEMPEDS